MFFRHLGYLEYNPCFNSILRVHVIIETMYLRNLDQRFSIFFQPRTPYKIENIPGPPHVCPLE